MLEEIKRFVPKKFTEYYEPFVGGGAVLFGLQPKKFSISDINTEIINVYETIKLDVEGLINELKKYKNEENYYYKIREMDRFSEFSTQSKVQRAARIIYLNKTCYN